MELAWEIQAQDSVQWQAVVNWTEKAWNILATVSVSRGTLLLGVSSNFS